MRATIDLAGLVSAEFITHDNVPGVFIPFEPNCTVKYDKGGRRAYASIHFYPSRPGKSFNQVGFQTIPQEYADKYLSSPRYAGKRDKVAWLWTEDQNQESGGVVSSADFDRIVGGR